MAKNKTILFLLLLCAPVWLSAQRALPILESVFDSIEGAAKDMRRFDVDNSPYFNKADLCGESISSTLIRLEHFKTYQQTSEYSCGPACALMALHYIGITEVSERQLALEMDARDGHNPRLDGSFGTSTSGIVTALKARGINTESSLDTAKASGKSFETEEEFAVYVAENISKGNVILVENVEWGGHWRVIAGYDDMGTAEVSDDVLLFADPYDTADHCQDGFTAASFSLFFYMWFDNGILPQSESVQQYVTIMK